jgi:hypothetical protein
VSEESEDLRLEVVALTKSVSDLAKIVSLGLSEIAKVLEKLLEERGEKK